MRAPTIVPMDTTLARSPIGHLLNGRYRVESHLARGGMADVYLGTDTRLERTVALKIMRAELASDEDFVRRFIGEARSVAQLSHPNVVAVYDQGADGRILYLAMEYVPGQSLRALLGERGRLSPWDALDIMEGVLSGLAAAHQAGLAHRDVKPENVLLSQGSGVKVVDFGLARLVSATSHTKTGMLIGTAAYLAPEQVAHGSADARSDVYSAGIMLFELLTGTQPHTGETPLAVAYKHVNEVVPAPSSVVPGLPPAADMLVAMATSRDPELRPADAGQFLSAVTGVRRSLPPPEPQPPGWAVPQAGPGRAALVPAAQPHGGQLEPYGDQPGPHRGQPSATAATSRLQQDAYQQDFYLPGAHRQSTHRPGAYQANPTLIVAPGGPEEPYGAVGDRRGREPRLQGLLFSRRLGYLAAVVAAAVVIGLVTWWQAAGKYVTVPKLTGLTVATARAELRATGLAVRVGSRREISNQVARGDVVRTSPDHGSRVSRGSVVTLIVSAGPRMIPMPQVTGQSLDAARAALRHAGLIPGPVTSQTSQTIPAGIVISTDPVAGTVWPQPRPVRLTVSAGPPLPDFRGQPKAAAEQWAQGNGVSLNEVTVKSDQPADTVVRQSPPPGRPFSQGEVVTIYVSAGPPMVSIPNLDGMDVKQAARVLRRLGFQVSVVQAGPLHTVFHYSPSGQAPKGSTVTLWAGMPSLG
jgi:serine/threonine protein kinase/beta-lactam-binding protein with PASTA domain